MSTFVRWGSLQTFSPFSYNIIGSKDESPAERADRLGDLPLDQFSDGTARAFWVHSNIWDVRRKRWFVSNISKSGTQTSFSATDLRIPPESWSDVPLFRFEGLSSEVKDLFEGKVIRTGSTDKFCSTKEAFARDCFLWSVADDISKGRIDVIPSCWAATTVKTPVHDIFGRISLNESESVVEKILTLSSIPEGEIRQVKSPRFFLLNEAGFDKEVDNEGTVWEEGIDSTFTWRISSDSPFVRASAMNSANAERQADRILRSAVSVMNCMKCLMTFGEEVSAQDLGQVALWLAYEGKPMMEFALDSKFDLSNVFNDENGPDGEYLVCITDDPIARKKANESGTAVDYVFSVSVEEDHLTKMKMTDMGYYGGKDPRREKLNDVMDKILKQKSIGNLNHWLHQQIYDFVVPSFRRGSTCYNRTPFRIMEMIDDGLIEHDHLGLVDLIFNEELQIKSCDEKEADHLGVLTYDKSPLRTILAGGIKGHKPSWKHETIKLFKSGLGAIAVKRNGKNLRCNKLGILTAIYRIVHDTKSVEGGGGPEGGNLRWERVDEIRETETEIVLNGLLSGRIGISGFTWAIAFLRDTNVKLTQDSACYLKQFHAENSGDGEFKVRQILKGSTLRRLEAIEFTRDGKREIGLDFDLPDGILAIEVSSNIVEVVPRNQCADIVKGRISNKRPFFLG